MNRKFFVAIVVVVVVVFGEILFIKRVPQKEDNISKVDIVASFYPLAHIATIIGGEFVSVNDLIPAGTEPHDFDPSSRQLVSIGEAELFLYNGAGFEPWINKWERSTLVRPVQVIDMANQLKGQNVSFIEKNGVIDPHFWLDPTIFSEEAKIVRDALIEIDPLHENIFRANTDHLLRDLEDLNQRFQEGFSSCTLRDIIVFHEAFGYLARRYDFSITAIAGISPEEEPSPKDLARVITFAREKGLKYIFSETIASPKFSEMIAREVGGTILTLNPIESLTPRGVQSGEDYFSVMEMNLNNLRSAMICK